MYYEVYVDSLFLVNFVMTLYLLLLVNQTFHRTATRRRMILGAALGAVSYIVPLWIRGPALGRMIAGLVIGTVLMLLVAFRIKSMKGFWHILEVLICYAFLMGGALLFLFQRIPIINKFQFGIFGVMGVGALLYLAISRLQKMRKEKERLCKVTLIGGMNIIQVVALVDSGNSLIEPISGKPVSIVDGEVLLALWKENPTLYRAIPYHSIGKNRGILKGYLFPEIRIENNGVIKVCKDIYIAASEERISGTKDAKITTSDKEKRGVRMIVNPALLE
ncbi:MAG: sigma-E processing peptidase SpoIIGA [Lachnospiraceae bacterium]|nr:sigma-E processing peptidase SpoIIGA [Lachnospiraceae bacterium]